MATRAKQRASWEELWEELERRKLLARRQEPPPPAKPFPEVPPTRIPGLDKPVPAPMPRIPRLEPPKELVPSEWKLGEPLPSEKPPFERPAEKREAPVSLEPRMEQMPRIVFPKPAPKPIRIPEGLPLRIPEPIIPPRAPPQLPELGKGERREERGRGPPAPTALGDA
jgi:hypothetical protein